MQIDEMRMDDLEQVAGLSAQLGYPYPVDALAHNFQLLANLDSHALYVARDGENGVVGWIQVNEESAQLVADARAEIAALIVDEKFRGRGIGSALLRKAEEWALRHELHLIRIRTNLQREDAHKFYEKEGYTSPKSWRLYTKTL